MTGGRVFALEADGDAIEEIPQESEDGAFDGEERYLSMVPIQLNSLFIPGIVRLYPCLPSSVFV